jgi:hypothetical protein
MSPENGQMQSRDNIANLPEPAARSTDAATPRLPLTWIIIGGVALLLGLIMGLVMSSLGK